MAERSNASVLKTDMEESIVGSNPTHASRAHANPHYANTLRVGKSSGY